MQLNQNIFLILDFSFFTIMRQAMFLAINKKKLKELSNTKLTFSETAAVNGGQTTDTGNDTLVPSNTTGYRCFVKPFTAEISPKVKP